MSHRPIVAEAKANLRLAVPLSLLQVTQLGMGVATTTLAAHGGQEVLAGVGLGSVVLSTMVVVAGGFFTAGGVLVADAQARGDRAAAQSLVLLSMVAAFAFGGVAIAAVIASEPLFMMAGEPASGAHLAAAFLRASAWGVPAAMGFAALRQLAAGLGRPRIPLATSLLGIATLVALGQVGGRAGVSTLEHARALGHATAAAYWIGAITLAIALLATERSTMPITGERNVKALAWSLVRLGAPTAAMFAAETGFFTTTTFLAGKLGTAALAAHHVAVQSSYLTFMIPSGIGMATALRVAGATDVRRARRAGLVGVALAVAFMVASTVVLVMAPRAIARLYFGFGPVDDETVALAASLLLIVGAFQVADGVQGVASAALRGCGIGFRTLVLAASSYWLVGVAGGATLAFVFAQGIRGLWWGIALGIGCAAVVLLAEFIRATADDTQN